MNEGIFYLLLRQYQKQDKKLEVQLFLGRLLALLALANRPRFCLILEVSALNLIVDLTISKAKSMGKEVAASFFEWSW